MTDEELVARYLQGDAEAFNTLAGRYQERMQRLAMRLLGNSEDALDAVQETMVHLLRSLPSFQGQARFSTWLYRLAVNTCIDCRRHRGRSAPTVTLDSAEPRSEELTEDPDVHCEKGFREVVIDQALKALPGPQRLLIVLRDKEELPYEEIAAILNIEVGTLKSRLHRARGALRRVLEAGIKVPGYEQEGVVRITPSGELV